MPDAEARQDRLAAALTALSFVWLGLPLLDVAQLAPQWDELIRLENAQRLFRGEMPYRDYFDHTPPLPDLLYAAVFAVVGGASAAAARLATLVLLAVAAAAGFLALRRRAVTRPVAAVCAAWLPTVGFFTWPIPHHHWVGAALGALAVASAHRPLVAGVFLGACFLSSQTAGLVAAAVGVAVLTAGPDPRRQATRVTVGVAGVAALFLAWMAIGGGLGGFIDFTLVFPFTGYSGAGGINTVTFAADLSQRLKMVVGSDNAAPLKALAVGQTVTAAAGLMLVLGVYGAGAARAWPNRPRAAALAAVAGAVVVAFLPRTDVVHAAVFAALPLMFTPVLLGHLPRVSRALGIVLAVSVVLGTASLLVNRALAGPPPSVRGPPSPDLAARPELAGLAEADAWMVAADRRLVRLRDYAVRHPGATLFASPVGAPAYFFALPPAVPYTLVYDPSVRYLRDVDYARIADALEKAPPDVIMFTTREATAAFFHPPAWRGGPAARIARVLRTHYRPWAEDGATTFLLRVGAPE